MSDESTVNDGGAQGDGPKELRDAYNALKKKYDTDLAELAGLQKSVRNNSLRGSFEKLGVRPGLSRFYDGDDTSEDAVKKWLEENAEDFGIDLQQNSPESQQQTQQVAEAQQRMAPATQSGNPPPVMPGSQEEFDRLIESQPVEWLISNGLLPDPTKSQLF